MNVPWQIWVDTGGTFTDCLGRDPSGRLHRAKVLSTSALRGVVVEPRSPTRFRVDERWFAPDDFIRGLPLTLLPDRGGAAVVTGYDSHSHLLDLDRPIVAMPGTAFEVRSSEEAPILAARLVTQTPADRPLPSLQMRLATTRGTNALLTRRGGPTALFITAGFGDLLRIGTQQRPDLFALAIRKPAPLYEMAVEVEERVASDGTVLLPLDRERLADDAARLVGAGITSAAVAFLHSDLVPLHEQQAAEILRQAGFSHVTCSSAAAPFVKILPRAETAVIDAYLAPLIDMYVAGVRSALGERSSLHVMTSAGGLAHPDSFRPKDSLLSGPAGGIVGAASAGRQSGFERIIAFDMGGTSTDVARFDGDFEYVWEHTIGDAHLVAPALAIESVAAGGGSICAFDKHGLRVGPDSAGAQPGPACYGAGGPLTLTDVNLLLGRLGTERFEIPIVTAHAEAAADALREAVEQETARPVSRDALLEGLLEIANERMAAAIRGVSIRRGYDPAGYALVAFGGAGGQHACGVAARLGMTTILVPPDAGLLSARGLGRAVIERFAERQVLQTLPAAEERIGQWIGELERQAARAVAGEGVPADTVIIRRRIVNLRLVGQEATHPIEYDPSLSLADAFAAHYAAVFGDFPAERAVEVESLRIIASSPGEADGAPPPVESSGDATPRSTVRAHFGGVWRDVPVYERADLTPGAGLFGPALVFEQHSATVIEPGWSGVIDGAGALMLRREVPLLSASEVAEERRPEAVELELFTNRFQAIAAQMGDQLQRTALSTNVKERLDFSCALLDADGELVVNAPHIPVHLGALGLCVRRVREALPMGRGDVVVTNHPGWGGSHLPDVTVVTPVHTRRGKLLGYVASRAHHGEIGGTRPGSMPPAATTLVEEGVVLPPMYLFRAGQARWNEVRRCLSDAPYPSRAVEDNLADLRAAVAANRRGAEALVQLAEEQGEAAVRRHMAALTARADRLLRDALARLPSRRYAAEEYLDDGSRLHVTLDLAGDGAIIDFAGSSAVHPGNLNATPAIVRSVVLYVLRLLVNEPLPLNEGLLRAVTLRVPPDSLLNPMFPSDPARCPAVVGGNVETSQRLVDTLLKALDFAACSQGTMNNVLWGTENFGYYETVCGGAGAGPDFDGADAVHTHMTNTRITDPEIIERRYPVRIERFAIRRGSGGVGRRRGGDGVVRVFHFLTPMSLSLLSQHRRTGPYGLAGGEPGQPGAQRIVRAGGAIVELGPIAACEVGPGDRLILETPGGGGYGKNRDSHKLDRENDRAQLSLVQGPDHQKITATDRGSAKESGVSTG